MQGFSDKDLRALSGAFRAMYPEQVGRLKDGNVGKYDKYRTDPIGYINRVLRKQLTPKQEEICMSLLTYPYRTIAVSANNQGKSFLAGALINWFYDCYRPGVCITTGPCFDEKTEILTDKGWKFIFELQEDDDVASLVDGKMKFVRPLDWMDYEHDGELIGYKGRDIDFLVTPNHRLYVKRFGRHIGPKYEWGFREAQDCYGQSLLRLNREVKWDGVDDDWTVKQYELFGFWMADGHARYGKSSGHNRYEVMVCQMYYPEYAKELMDTLGEEVKRYKRPATTGVRNNKESHTFHIYGKKWAKFFRENFYDGKTKCIPDWMMNATAEKCKAFVDGYYMGDGDKANPSGAKRIMVYEGKEFANRLQILSMKAGYVANLLGPHRKPDRDMDVYHLGLLSANMQKQFPQTHGKHWYKEKYQGRVRCVKVPSGIVMVRRNGTYHWSGNTDRHVKDVLWKEVRTQRKTRWDFKGDRMPEMYDAPDHYAKGYTGNTAEAFHGRHDEHLFFVVDEAVGVGEHVFRGIKSMFKPNGKHFWLNLLNPTDTTTTIYAEEQSGEYHSVRLSALDHPNIIAELKGEEIVIPGAVEMAMLNTWFKDWFEEVHKDDYRPGDVIWPPNWSLAYGSLNRIGKGKQRVLRPSADGQSRVLGLWPTASEWSVWNDRSWQSACRRLPDQTPIKLDWRVLPQIGCDVSRGGGDKTEVIVQCDNIALEHRVGSSWDVPRTYSELIKYAEKYCQIYNENRPKTEPMATPKHIVMNIDDDGVGGGVTDFLRAAGYNAVGVGAGSIAEKSHKYPLMRDQLWFETVMAANADDIDLSRLPEKSLVEMKRQAMAVRFENDHRGRRFVWHKDKTRKVIGRSPDSMDALNLAFCRSSGSSDAPTVLERNSSRG